MTALRQHKSALNHTNSLEDNLHVEKSTPKVTADSILAHPRSSYLVATRPIT